MTQRDAAPEELALAERIAWDQWPNSLDYPERDAARTAALSAIQQTTELAIKEVEQYQQDFLSPQYATGQPASSFGERFACDEIIHSLRRGDHLKEVV